MRASQARPVYKALANHVIGRASLAYVERLLKETGGIRCVQGVYRDDDDDARAAA